MGFNSAFEGLKQNACLVSFSGTFLSLRIFRPDKNNVLWSSCKVPVILVRFWWNSSFLDRFSKYVLTSNFTKTRPVGAELFPAWRTQRHETFFFAILRTSLKTTTKSSFLLTDLRTFNRICSSACHRFRKHALAFASERRNVSVYSCNYLRF